MKKLLAVLALLFSFGCMAGPAMADTTATPTCTLSGWGANAGSNVLWHVKCSAPSTVSLVTNDGTAKAPVDYDAVAQTVSVPVANTVVIVNNVTHVTTDKTKYGTTLNFGARLYYNGNLASNAGSLIIEPKGQTCPDGEVILASATCAVPPPPPAPTTQTCYNGLVIPVVDKCPPQHREDIIPASTGYDRPDGSMQIGGLPFIPSTFDLSNSLEAFSIPVSAYPDDIGAFRFICGPGQVLGDDPVVFPGWPGKSHLHQFFGNVEVDANHYTYASLRAGKLSTCVTGGDVPAVNLSGYWMPAALDGKGNVVRPDYVAIYYKRVPANSQYADPTNPKFRGIPVPVPNGLDFIIGYNMATNVMQGAYWNCTGPSAKPGRYTSIDAILAAGACPTALVSDGKGHLVHNQLLAELDAFECWNGTQLDSPDHRSHMAYRYDTHLGYAKCDAQHPYIMPFFHMMAAFTVDDNLPYWHLASDPMATCTGHGCSLHADFFSAWENPVLYKWDHDGCIDHLLNCSGGVMGNGQAIRHADEPPASFLNGTWYQRAWLASPRLVPLSQIPGGDKAM